MLERIDVNIFPCTSAIEINCYRRTRRNINLCLMVNMTKNVNSKSLSNSISTCNRSCSSSDDEDDNVLSYETYITKLIKTFKRLENAICLSNRKIA